MSSLKMPGRFVDVWEGHIFDIGQSRSICVRDALRVKDVTHLLFVDDDIIIPSPDTVLLMMSFLEAKPASIVSGLYYNKSFPHFPLIMNTILKDGRLRFSFPIADKEIKKGNSSVLKVGVVPGGFLLVKREVFETLPWPPFVYNAPEIRALCMDPDEHPPGEDVYFSLKTREAGYELFVDMRRPLLHYAPKFVGPSWLVDEFVHNATHESEVAATIAELENEKKV